MKTINQNKSTYNYSFKRFLLLIILPIFIIVSLAILRKLLVLEENAVDQIFPALFILIMGLVIGLIVAFPFLLIFAATMEKLYILNLLKNKFLCFIYAGFISIFTFSISTILPIWFMKQRYDILSIKMLMLMFVIHGLVALFVYRDKVTNI